MVAITIGEGEHIVDETIIVRAALQDLKIEVTTSQGQFAFFADADRIEGLLSAKDAAGAQAKFRLHKIETGLVGLKDEADDAGADQ